MRVSRVFTAGLLFASASQAGASGAIGSDALAATSGSYAASIPAASDYRRGRAALVAGEYDRAVFLLEPLADGAGPQSQLLAGFANLGAGRLGRAELYFNRAIAQDRHSPFGLNGLGLVALAKGDRAGAAAQLRLLERAGQRCSDTCSRGADINRAIASLRRAIG